MLVIFLWTAGLAFLVGLAWLFGVRRHAAVLAGAILASVGVPMFFLALKASKDGLYWSGRYGLPYSVGVPIIAGIAIARSDSARMVIRSRLVAILAGLFVTAELLAYGQELRRYTVGRDGEVLFFLRVFSYSWAPAVIGHPIVLLGAFGVLILVLAAVLFWFPTQGLPEPVEPTAASSPSGVATATGVDGPAAADRRANVAAARGSRRGPTPAHGVRMGESG